MAKKVEIREWIEVATNNREIHYFEKDSNKYVFGYNSGVVPRSAVVEFLEKLNLEIDHVE